MTDLQSTPSDLATDVGRLTVVVAHGGRVPQLAGDLREVRVDASTARGSLATLAMSDRAAHALDPWEATPTAAWDRMREGLRRTLLGDEPATHVGGTFLASLERLAQMDGRPLVWTVERAHLADAETRGWLSRQVRHMRRWPVAVVVGVAPEDPWGVGVASQARRIWGASTVVDLSGVRPSHTGAAPPVVDAPVEEAARPEAAPDLPEPLSPACQTTLLAAAVAGSPIELGRVAALVGLSESVVASHLQQAHLAGIPLSVSDAGVSLHPDAERMLAAQVLPPVRTAWAAELGFAPPAEPAAGHGAASETASTAADLPVDDLAAHVEALLGRAEAARQQGGWAEASRALEQASVAVESMGAAGIRPGAQTRLARARLAWSAAGQGVDLPVALAAAQAAEAELRDVAGPVEAAEANRLVAAIAHDIGDAAHLELALERLTVAIRDLREGGRPRTAARLLNDQAAVWVRVGDPVRAVHLLEESRSVFAAGADPSDRYELAETLLLMARLPLHVKARPGLEQAALDKAMADARASADIWSALGDRRGHGLALETEGRLLRRAGQSEAALERLHAALRELRAVRDALGLARVADALSHALIDLERWEDGVRYLAESVRFNSAVGSSLGLAYNEASAHRLRANVPPDSVASRALDDLLAAHDDARDA